MAATSTEALISRMRAQLVGDGNGVVTQGGRPPPGTTKVSFAPSPARAGYGAQAVAPSEHHSSLLTTPASRNAGGRLTHQPSPSVLGKYERRLEGETGMRRTIDGSSSRRTLNSERSRHSLDGSTSRLDGGSSTTKLAGPPGPYKFTPRDPSPYRPKPPQQPLPQPAPRAVDAAAAVAAAAAGRSSFLEAGGASATARAVLGLDGSGRFGTSTASSSPVKKPLGAVLEPPSAAAAARPRAPSVAAIAIADLLAAHRPSLNSVGGAAPVALGQRGSIIGMPSSGQAASYHRSSVAGVPSSGQAASSHRSSMIEEHLRQMQLSIERTAAQNSRAVASSGSPAAAFERSTSWHASRQQPPEAASPQHRWQQQPGESDFLISAAFPGGRGSVAGATAAAAGSKAGSFRAPYPPAAAAASADEDEGPVSLRLQPMFDALQGLDGRRPSLPGRGTGSSRGSVLAATYPQPDLPVAPSDGLLRSKVGELEAQLRLERMRSQDVSSVSSDLRQLCAELQQQVQQQAEALEAAQQQAAEAERRANGASDQAAKLRSEVQRRQSVHSDGVESVTRLQAVSQVQRQENEDLRQRVHQLGDAWEQENAQVARLQQQLQDARASSGAGEQEVAERLRRAEEEWEQRLRAVEEQALQQQQKLSSDCQLALIQKAAHEQAAQQAAGRLEAAEQRCETAEARWRQLAAELDSTAGQGQQLAAARRQTEAAGDAARQLRMQLLEQQQRCEELEEALQGERERSSSQASRAETAEVAQQGLGTHVKAAHAHLQHLQDQVAAAKQDVRQLQAQNEELREAQLASISALERQVGELAAAQSERDLLRQQLSKATSELDAQLAAAGQHRQQTAAQQQADRELRAALKSQETAAAQQSRQAVTLQSKCEALEARVAQAEAELVQAKQRAASAEDRLAKSGRAGGPAIQEALGTLRSELQEKDLQLMQMHEDLTRERGKAQDLQKQVLDQAVELDEAQRDASDVFALRQQLATAQQAEAHLRKELGQLRQQLQQAALAGSWAPGGVPEGSGGHDGKSSSPRTSSSGGRSSSGGSPGASPQRAQVQMSSGTVATLQRRLEATTKEVAGLKQEMARLKGDKDRLRDELDTRDSEVQLLQGQLVVMRNQAADEHNWLSPLPDPYR